MLTAMAIYGILWVWRIIWFYCNRLSHGAWNIWFAELASCGLKLSHLTRRINLNRGPRLGYLSVDFSHPISRVQFIRRLILRNFKEVEHWMASFTFSLQTRLNHLLHQVLAKIVSISNKTYGWILLRPIKTWLNYLNCNLTNKLVPNTV